MLYVKGKVLACIPRDVNFVRDGQSKSFKAHRCVLHDPTSNALPVTVELGETPLEIGKAYRVPVSLRSYSTRSGDAQVQINGIRNLPPEEISLATPGGK